MLPQLAQIRDNQTMNHSAIRTALLAACAWACFWAPPVLADNLGSATVRPRPAPAQRFDGISLDEAVSRAEAQFKARVVRTDTTDDDGRRVYVLKLLSEDGRVFNVRIDAASGRVL
jgi:hypothetical protein